MMARNIPFQPRAGMVLEGGWVISKVSPNLKRVTIYLPSSRDGGYKVGKHLTFNWDDGMGTWKRQGQPIPPPSERKKASPKSPSSARSHAGPPSAPKNPLARRATEELALSDYSVTYEPGWGHEGETIYRGVLYESGVRGVPHDKPIPIATWAESGTGGAMRIEQQGNPYNRFLRLVESMDLSYLNSVGEVVSVAFERPAWVIGMLLEQALTGQSPKKPSPKRPTSRKPSPKKPSPKKPISRKPSPKKPTSRKPSPKKPTSRKPSPKKPTSRKPSPKKPTSRKPSPKAALIDVPLIDVQGSGPFTVYWETSDPKTIHRYSYGSKQAAMLAAQDRARALGMHVSVMKGGIDVFSTRDESVSRARPGAKQPSGSRRPSAKRPTPRKVSGKKPSREIKLRITYRTAFRKLAAIEGKAWARKQREGGIGLDNGFFLNRRAYETIIELGLGGSDIPLAELDPTAGVIEGANGEAYIVMPDGEIMLDGESATSEKREEAAKVMQVI